MAARRRDAHLHLRRLEVNGARERGALPAAAAAERAARAQRADCAEQCAAARGHEQRERVVSQARERITVTVSVQEG